MDESRRCGVDGRMMNTVAIAAMNTAASKSFNGNFGRLLIGLESDTDSY